MAADTILIGDGDSSNPRIRAQEAPMLAVGAKEAASRWFDDDENACSP